MIRWEQMGFLGNPEFGAIDWATICQRKRAAIFQKDRFNFVQRPSTYCFKKYTYTFW